MHKYLLRFYKRGNMRFLSHLDLGRLFRRAIKRAEIDVEFSNGFNPHEKINIVQPLSLGFEGESEYFEIATKRSYDEKDLMELLNASMPTDIAFYECRTLDSSINNMSNKTQAALYNVYVKGSKEEFEALKIEDFLNRDEIYVLKRDKKTKTMDEKNVRTMVYSVTRGGSDSEGYYLNLAVRCASNESLNPVNLLASLYKFSGMEFTQEDSRISRMDLMTTNFKNEYVPLFDFDKNEEF